MRRGWRLGPQTESANVLLDHLVTNLVKASCLGNQKLLFLMIEDTLVLAIILSSAEKNTLFNHRRRTQRSAESSTCLIAPKSKEVHRVVPASLLKFQSFKAPEASTLARIEGTVEFRGGVHARRREAQSDQQQRGGRGRGSCSRHIAASVCLDSKRGGNGGR